jgi:hypothetical protein
LSSGPIRCCLTVPERDAVRELIREELKERKDLGEDLNEQRKDRSTSQRMTLA